MRQSCARAPRRRTSSVVTGSSAVSSATTRMNSSSVAQTSPDVGSGAGPYGASKKRSSAMRPALEHVDHVERLHEREGVGAHRRAERGALFVGGAGHVDHELLGEGDARGGAGSSAVVNATGVRSRSSGWARAAATATRTGSSTSGSTVPAASASMRSKQSKAAGEWSRQGASVTDATVLLGIPAPPTRLRHLAAVYAVS